MSTTDLPPAPPPPPPGPSDPGPRVSGHDMRNLGLIRRTAPGSPYGHQVAGVAGGIARHFDVDPTVVRVVLAVLACFGPGGLIYLVMWALAPSDDGTPPLVRMDDSSRNLVLWIGAGLGGSAVVAATLPPWHHSVWWWGWSWPWTALIVVFFVLPAWRRRTRAETTPPPPEATNASTTTVPGDAPVPHAPWLRVDPATASVTMSRPRRTPRPPRTGPVLFWPTLALIALAEGLLGMVDVASGVHVVPAAYPAVAVAIVAIALVVGAFWGRAGGLVAVGILGVLATLGATAGHELAWGGDATDTPRTAAAVAGTYDRMGIGRYTLDLTRIRDPRDLDGRTVHVSGHVGDLEIDVPADWGLDFTAHLHGAGEIDADGSDGHHGLWSRDYPPATAADPTIAIDADLRFGLIDLRRIP